MIPTCGSSYRCWPHWMNMFSCQILVFSEKSKLSVVIVVRGKFCQQVMKALECHEGLWTVGLESRRWSGEWSDPCEQSQHYPLIYTLGMYTWHKTWHKIVSCFNYCIILYYIHGIRHNIRLLLLGPIIPGANREMQGGILLHKRMNVKLSLSLSSW